MEGPGFGPETGVHSCVSGGVETGDDTELPLHRGQIKGCSVVVINLFRSQGLDEGGGQFLGSPSGTIN